MQEYINTIEQTWEKRHTLSQEPTQNKYIIQVLNNIIEGLNQGIIRVCQKDDDKWVVNQWVKKAILLYFQLVDSRVYSDGCIKWYDKINPKFSSEFDDNDFKKNKYRIVPGAYIRSGSYIAKNVVVMPSFINIGAYVGEGSMIDTWVTIGSCAQVGDNCHISGGVGIGGVLEPLQAKPVIIENNCFIGARSEIVEGVIIEEGSVISMGVFIGASTKIVDRASGEIIYGRVPPYSVVVPGNLPANDPSKPSLYCAVIIKKVDEATRRKTAINELLRYAE
jgi:2,3,4,5-tetrahydropyridine-2-carboxylate N-succinyltransferase